MPHIDLTPYKEDPSLRLLDWEFGEMLVRRGGVSADDAAAVTLLGAKCLQAVDNGHSCLDLKNWSNAVAESSEQTAADGLSGPDLKDGSDADAENPEHAADHSPMSCEEWVELLDRIGGIASEEKDTFTPLYFDREHSLLYLRKYFLAELRIAAAVCSRSGKESDIAFNGEPEERIHGISKLYAAKPFDEDLQQQAVAMALTKRFSILTGGPGTGKTTTLASFLALVVEEKPGLRIALAAPTGKASVQMKESLADELRNNLNVSEPVRERLKDLPCRTLHRLLGIGADGAKPRYNRNNVLLFDLIVVDEVSMVSLKLLDTLFEALSPDCQVLLIGDQYQLASVEAGSVLGDFCSRCGKLSASADGPLDRRHITRLWENHRADNPWLKAFLRKMNTGVHQNKNLAEDLKGEIDELYKRTDAAFAARELSFSGTLFRQRESLREELEKQIGSMLGTMKLPDDFKKYFGEEVVAGIKFSLDEWRKLKVVPGNILQDKPAQLPLALSLLYLNSFRVICAVHAGLFGERSINRMIGELLGKKKGTNGAPLLVLQNDPETGLSNGDTGILWNGRVCFPEWKINAAGLRIFSCSRSFLPYQLPESTLAYAITIHKSQGAGYDNVLMMLPDRDSRIVTRELIYTGISRTRKNFMLWGKRNIFEAGIDRPTVRWSGLPYRFE